MIPPAGQAPSMIEMEEVGNGVNGRHVEKTEIEDFIQVGPGQWAKKTKTVFDPITRPEHYCKGDIEPWEFIEAQSLGFHEGSAVSYIARARHKGDEIGDLRKAINFLSRKVKLLENSHI